jgi:pimeloyl-ACP methyl ester carboxylesterase
MSDPVLRELDGLAELKEAERFQRLVWGEDDPWIPLARGEALHERMPQAEFATLSGVGHLPQLEAPDRASREIQAFLERPA